MSVTVSLLRFFLLWIPLSNYVVNAKFSFRPANSTCVWTERQLRKVIEKASNTTRTRITLCRQKISISNIRTSSNYTGIEVSNRFIDLRCYLKPSVGTCVLDGQGSSRIFVGDQADLTVRNINFINAKPVDCDNDGAAVLLFRSNVTFTGCSFMNNGNACLGETYGGGIAVLDSSLMINGGSTKRPVMFSDNYGNYGGALYAENSNVSIDTSVIFLDNEGYEGGAVYADGSKVSIDGFTVFSNNIGYNSGGLYLYDSTAYIKNAKFQKNHGDTTSALATYESQTTMKNVVFIENEGFIRVTYFRNASLHATNCTFYKNNSTALGVVESKVTLKNSTFSNNLYKGDESDIYIYDDEDPSFSGSLVKCESKVVFCNVIDTEIIDEYSSDETFGNFNNTDCRTKGRTGTPGQGSCPI